MFSYCTSIAILNSTCYTLVIIACAQCIAVVLQIIIFLFKQYFCLKKWIRQPAHAYDIKILAYKNMILKC